MAVANLSGTTTDKTVATKELFPDFEPE